MEMYESEEDMYEFEDDMYESEEDIYEVKISIKETFFLILDLFFRTTRRSKRTQLKVKIWKVSRELYLRFRVTFCHHQAARL
jgi:hypothetical protein